MSSSHIDRVLPAAWLLILAAFGGASRYDEWQQVVVVAASIVVLVTALWNPSRFAVPGKSTLWLFLAVVAALIGLQLVPLPPSLWASLPGRAPFVLGAQLTNLDGVWRPLTLTPDLTWGSLFSLLPVAATLAIAPSARARGMRPLLWTMIAVFSVSTVFGLGQSLGSSEMRLYRIANVDSAIGVFANRNHHAIFLTLAFPIIVLLLANERSRSVSRPLAIGIAASIGMLYVISILQAGSRSGLILCALMLSILLTTIARGDFPLARRSYGKRAAMTHSVQTTRLPLIISGLALVALASMASVVNRSAAFQRLLLSDVTYEARVQNFPIFVKMAKEFAPVGSGFGSFSALYRHFEPFESLSFTYLNQAHNDIIQAIIEGGIPAALIMLVVAIAWFRQTWLIVRQQSGLPRQIGIAGSVIVLTLFVASLVDYPLRTPLLAGMLVFGTVFMLRDQSSSEDEVDAGLLSDASSPTRRPSPYSEEFS